MPTDVRAHPFPNGLIIISAALVQSHLKRHPRCGAIVTLTSTALGNLAESTRLRLLIRPLRTTNEPVDKFFMERLSRRFPWVAPSQSLRHEREADRAVRRRMEGNGNVTVPQGTAQGT